MLRPEAGPNTFGEHCARAPSCAALRGVIRGWNLFESLRISSACVGVVPAVAQNTISSLEGAPPTPPFGRVPHPVAHNPRHWRSQEDSSRLQSGSSPREPPSARNMLASYTSRCNRRAGRARVTGWPESRRPSRKRFEESRRPSRKRSEEIPSRPRQARAAPAGSAPRSAARTDRRRPCRRRRPAAPRPAVVAAVPR